ncbi:hypothetical protein [Ideonella sp.]|uniref:hypothetical protein n=1 Tax=Ideonella sp. TaxID=1929293 RepID=UPI002B45C692|nr:hypothetical protein [Ideonella sp.]HJV67711.1 hypothetical protein [Ideonella sp.]
MVHLKASLRPALLAVLFSAALGPAAAATIYGSVSENQQPAANRPIELLCPGQKAVPATTDARGSYRFTVGTVGGCTVRVGTAEAPVILSVNPAQYNFELRSVNGRLVLVQR